jgi:hypothetical protein
MDERILRFISALRTAGVRISLAESADAFQAVQELGVRNRETFRVSLRATLVKEARDLPAFDDLFPLFFDAGAPPPLMDLTQDLLPGEAEQLARLLRQYQDRLRQMLERLLRGEQLSPEELEKLARMVGLNQATDMRHRRWLAQRMERALAFREVREALRDLSQTLQQMGMDRQRVEQLRQLLQANQQAISDQLDQFAGQRIAENMSQQPPDEGGSDLLDRPFNHLSEREMATLRKEVQRLAKVLRTRVALRQKRAKSGALDAKGTIRANLKHGSVPLELKHRQRSLKPKLVAICDVSTSMRSASELMLTLLYALQDQIQKTHAFAFIDHMEYISPDFVGREAQDAVGHVLQRMPSGYYNTDLGYSLKNLVDDHLDLVDGHTVLIIVGDGRNNYNNPRTDLLNLLSRRAHRTIWLTPEPPGLWGSGDSDMLKYAPSCSAIFEVNTLSQLAAAVDKLLSQR